MKNGPLKAQYLTEPHHPWIWFLIKRYAGVTHQSRLVFVHYPFKTKVVIYAPSARYILCRYLTSS